MMKTALSVEGFSVWRGRSEIVRSVDLEVGEGELVCLLGSNGAGKTTLTEGLLGVIPARARKLEFHGRAIAGLRPWHRVRAGIVLVPQERSLFAGMTVQENLLVGAKPRSKAGPFDLAAMYELFPRLKDRAGQFAGTLSGGERSMLAIARGLMLQPRTLVLDEPSLGLAPVIVQTIMRTIGDINAAGVSVLLIEQNVHQALRLASRGYVLDGGKIIAAGTAESLLASNLVEDGYLGSTTSTREER
ncbi:ABC transporter ATP-binding protein [Micromonospora sp. NPDC005173]|uniref:ABC transporter ATP-binding protein n=1 Tax=Micromonospora sp. NPDC005173 TaxID=3157165 RepID=UPI0033AA5439